MDSACPLLVAGFSHNFGLKMSKKTDIKFQGLQNPTAGI